MMNQVPILAITLSLILLSAAASHVSAVQRPNIILCMADDQGWGDVGFRDHRVLKTPVLDEMAAAGLRLDRFYAAAPVCSPTRAALLSGCYPGVVGVPGVLRTHPNNNWGYLSPQCSLLPKYLKSAGYRTALIGKWHLGLAAPNTPNDRGFDHFHGWLVGMMDDYYTHRRHGINYMQLNGRSIDPEGHATDLFTDWAVEYLKGQSSADHPFFLCLAYNAPHTPIQPPEDWVKQVRRREPKIGGKRAKLVALIEHMDAGVGRVMDART